MLRFTATAVILGVLVALPAQAQTLDFEDLTVGTLYESGDSFVTHGITVEAIPTPFVGQISVADDGFAGGSGNELQILDAVGLGFTFPNSPASVTMKIGNGPFGGTFNVNASLTSLVFTSLSDLDGESIGDVDFTLLSSQSATPVEFGVLRLTGVISSIRIDGTRIAIDDVVAIPEPASLMTLLTLGSCAALRRRRGLSPRSPGLS